MEGIIFQCNKDAIMGWRVHKTKCGVLKILPFDANMLGYESVKTTRTSFYPDGVEKRKEKFVERVQKMKKR